MAVYYWVGGSGTWDGTSTTNWATSSGGSGGAGVPTSADTVNFDTGSNATAYTVTMGTGALCFNMNMSGPTTGKVTWAGSTALSVYGSMVLSGTATNGGVNPTYSGLLTFAGTSSGLQITTNGVTLVNSVVINGVGGTWTLGSAFSCNTFDISAGTFDTSASNYSVTTAAGFPFRILSSAAARIVNLNGSTITCDYFYCPSITGVTFNAGTSTINMVASSGANVQLGGLTFYNMVINTNSNSNVTWSILDSATNTFSTLTYKASSTAPSFNHLTLSGNITCSVINLNFGSADQTSRLFVRSYTIGTSRSISTTGYASPVNSDFRDITASSVNFTSLTPSTVGDCGGNSNLSFAAGKTVYWNLAGTQSWAAVGWASTSGGTPAATNFPLAQDTVVIDNNSGAAGLNLQMLLPWNIGAIDTSTRTTTLTLINANSGAVVVHGNITLSSSTTWSTGGFTVSIAGRGTQIFNQNGATFTYMALQQVGVGGTFRLGQALTIPANMIHQAGTFDLNGYTFTCSAITDNSSAATRSIAFGTGNIVVTGSATTIVQLASITGFSYTGTPNINCTYSGSIGTRTINTFAGGGTEATSLNINITAGSDTVQLAGGAGQAFRNLDFTGFSGTIPLGNAIWVYGSLTLSTGLTISSGYSQLTLTGTSGTKTITTAGKTQPWPVIFDGAGSTWQLLDDFNASGAVSLGNGTLNLNGKTLTSSYVATNAGTKNITFNGGTINCTGTGATPTFNNVNPTGFTTTRGTADGKITFTGGNPSKIFTGGGSIYNCIIEQNGIGQLFITDSNTFQDLQATSAGAGQIFFDNGSTTTFYFFTLGKNNTGLKYVGAPSATCTFTKQAGVVATDYIAPSNIAATGGATWYAGTHSSTGSGNSGWIFTDPPSRAGSQGMVTNFFLN